jgi:opacity protein-like surface antigen
MRTIRRLPVCGAAVLLLAGTCFAQSLNKIALTAGGGFTEPVVHSDSRFDPGFHFGFGAGYKLHPRLTLMGEFGFYHLGVSSRILNNVGAPDGSGRIYSVTANPVVHLNPRGRFDPYLIGGGGYYRRTVEFTEPAVKTVTAFDPFFGFVPVNVATNVVLGSFTQNSGGLNIGGGFSMRLRGESNTSFFAETRYHYLFTNPVRTTVLPVTFGIRW